MKKQRIILPKYDNWEIYAYYAVNTYHIDEILEHLYDIGIDGGNAKQAYLNMSQNKLDTGLCYSNYAKRKTIIVVAKCSSAKEFLNSMTHEVSHACTHIATALFVDLRSEDYAYMVGDVCMEMYPIVKDLLCDCHKNEYNYEKEEKKNGYSYYGIG